MQPYLLPKPQILWSIMLQYFYQHDVSLKSNMHWDEIFGQQIFRQGLYVLSGAFLPCATLKPCMARQPARLSVLVFHTSSGVSAPQSLFINI